MIKIINLLIYKKNDKKLSILYEYEHDQNKMLNTSCLKVDFFKLKSSCFKYSKQVLVHGYYFVFDIDTVQHKRSHHARTLTLMNTRTQILPLWAPLKDWAPADLEILEVTTVGAECGPDTNQ
jgi:hypothetical protein